MPEMIAQHQRAHPHIRWLCGSLQSPDLLEQLGSYDIAFLLEVLQYVPAAEALGALWKRLLPGGRIVGVVPNADCEIVSRTRARFGANYAPPTLGQIEAVLQGWDELEYAAYRGLSFAQRSAPGSLRGLALADFPGLGVRAESPPVRRHQAFGSERV